MTIFELNANNANSILIVEEIALLNKSGLIITMLFKAGQAYTWHFCDEQTCTKV